MGEEPKLRIAIEDDLEDDLGDYCSDALSVNAALGLPADASRSEAILAVCMLDFRSEQVVRRANAEREASALVEEDTAAGRVVLDDGDQTGRDDPVDDSSVAASVRAILNLADDAVRGQVIIGICMLGYPREQVVQRANA